MSSSDGTVPTSTTCPLLLPSIACYLHDRHEKGPRHAVIQSQSSFLSCSSSYASIPEATELGIAQSSSHSKISTPESNYLRNLLKMFHIVYQFAAACIRWLISALYTIISDDSGDKSHVIQGLSAVFIVGTILGLLFPLSSQLNGTWYPYLSAILGYTYCFSWSISYYPQILQNYRRKDTQGLSVDFCVLQLYGCACYALLNFSMYYSSTIRSLYALRHDGHENLVQPNDVLLSAHSLLLSFVWMGQVWFDNGCTFRHRAPSWITVALLAVVSCCFIFYMTMIIWVLGADQSKCLSSSSECDLFSSLPSWILSKLNWLDFLYALTAVKILIILLSYLPQAILNCQLHSTAGWNIWGILLDFIGGVLSVLQLVLDSWNTKDWSGISGDAAKFGLGFVSIAFDVSYVGALSSLVVPSLVVNSLSSLYSLRSIDVKAVFFLQHYVLYRKRENAYYGDISHVKRQVQSGVA